MVGKIAVGSGYEHAGSGSLTPFEVEDCTGGESLDSGDCGIVGIFSDCVEFDSALFGLGGGVFQKIGPAGKD